MTEEERKRRAADARRRLEEVVTAIAAEGRFGGPSVTTSELDMLEDATRLVKEAVAERLAKKNPEV